MREYGKVSPRFWTGKTGKAIRGDFEAQIVALYLMTSPHSTMIGVFHQPVTYMAIDTGLPLEGAWKGLRRCIEAGFCTYDEEAEIVFVVEMAVQQIGEELKPGDNRLKNIRKQYEEIASEPVRAAFHRRYAAEYGLPDDCEIDANQQSPSEGPSKPLRSQEQEQEQERSNTLSTADAADPAEGDAGLDDLASKRKERELRLSQVTDDAIKAYNALLSTKGDPAGLLAWVHVTVGRENRRKHVGRSVRVCQQICQELYGNAVITAEFWAQYFESCAADEFMSGRGPYTGEHRNWRPDFEYLTRPETILRVFDRSNSEDAA